MAKVIFILGSSRAAGNTRALVDILNSDLGGRVLDLSSVSISYYDYLQNNRTDDFLSQIDIVLQADVVVFATPVYWYAMSAQMKTFFDRFSGLLDLYKPRGRALKGKKTFLVSTGTEPQLPEGFDLPFKKTSEYFGMEYGGYFYGQVLTDLVVAPETLHLAKDFVQKLSQACGLESDFYHGDQNNRLS